MSDGKDGMSQQPWYQDGLKFRCTGCGDCCTGAPGYVWVNKEEIAALAVYLASPAADGMNGQSLAIDGGIVYG